MLPNFNKTFIFGYYVNKAFLIKSAVSLSSSISPIILANSVSFGDKKSKFSKNYLGMGSSRPPQSNPTILSLLINFNFLFYKNIKHEYIL